MILPHVKLLCGFWEKSVGLIGADPVYPVFFTTRWGIHTFGMKAAIDVVILDTENRAVKLTRNLPPNRLLFWNPWFSRVLELPAGSIKKYKIIFGEKIIFAKMSR